MSRSSTNHYWDEDQETATFTAIQGKTKPPTQSKPYVYVKESTKYWKGQMIHISKAEIQDGDSHYNNFDLDLDKEQQ
jgi:hypothetical protein